MRQSRRPRMRKTRRRMPPRTPRTRPRTLRTPAGIPRDRAVPPNRPSRQAAAAEAAHLTTTAVAQAPQATGAVVQAPVLAVRKAVPGHPAAVDPATMVQAAATPGQVAGPRIAIPGPVRTRPAVRVPPVQAVVPVVEARGLTIGRDHPQEVAAQVAVPAPVGRRRLAAALATTGRTPNPAQAEAPEVQGPVETRAPRAPRAPRAVVPAAAERAAAPARPAAALAVAAPAGAREAQRRLPALDRRAAAPG